MVITILEHTLGTTKTTLINKTLKHWRNHMNSFSNNSNNNYNLTHQLLIQTTTTSYTWAHVVAVEDVFRGVKTHFPDSAVLWCPLALSCSLS